MRHALFQTIPDGVARRQRHRATTEISLLLLSLTWTAAAWAATTLDVRVVRGGVDLDFGVATPGQPSRTEELELSVTNTGAGPYRLYQELRGSLVNERGERLPDGALVMQLSRGLTGTLPSGGVVPVTDSPQELFVSSSSGTSDTVLAAYTIAAVPQLPAGSYRGLLRFTVESSETGALVTETIHVTVTVNATVRLERVDVGSGQLAFGTLDPGERSSSQELAFALVNNSGSPTHMTQELLEPLTSGRGDALPMERVEYTVTSQQGTSGGTLARGPQTLIEDQAGSAQQVRLAYVLSPPPDQPAGQYRGRVRLRLVSPDVSSPEEVTLSLEVEVRELFTMSVKPLDEAEGRLHFPPPAAAGEVVERSLLVEMHTNLGRPYQILAGLDHALVLESGETLPAEALVWSVPRAERGSALIAAGPPVPVGFEPIYRSDAGGSSDSFVVTYRLTIPPEAKSGVYSGQLHFTATFF